MLDPFTLESDSFTENISPYKVSSKHQGFGSTRSNSLSGGSFK